MGIFKKPKAKKFNYKPRYYKFDGEGSPFSIKHKFDKHRKTTKASTGLKGKFNSAFNELRSPQERRVTYRLVLIILILVLIFLYIIDFDLSIFKQAFKF